MKYSVLIFFMLLNVLSSEAVFAIEINEDEVNLFNNSEGESLGFVNPQGFQDNEFEELQRAYINPKYFNLEDLKKIPTDQLSNEFVQKLINLINAKVQESLRKDMISYLDSILKDREKRNFNPSRAPQIGSAKPSSQFKKDFFEPHQLTSGEALKNPSPKNTKQEQIKNIINVEKSQAPRFNSNAGRITNVQFGHVNDHFISINGLSRETISTRVSYTSAVDTLDVSFYIRNINNSMVYLLKRSTEKVKGSGTKTFTYNWIKPQIPFGKYKVFVSVRFQKGSSIVNREEKYWGNPSVKDFVVYKN